MTRTRTHAGMAQYRLGMPFRAQMQVNSFNQMCPTRRKSTASHRSGGSRYSPASFLSCFLLLRPSNPSSSTWLVAERRATWSSWFCQYIGVPQQAASPQLVCPCNRHIIDVYGDHIHT